MAGRKVDLAAVAQISQELKSMAGSYNVSIADQDAGNSLGEGYEAIQDFLDGFEKMKMAFRDLMLKTSQYLDNFVESYTESDESDAAKIRGGQ